MPNSDSSSSDRLNNELLETFRQIDSVLSQLEVVDSKAAEMVHGQILLLKSLELLFEKFATEAQFACDDLGGLAYLELLGIFKRELQLIVATEASGASDTLQILKRCFRLLPALVGRAGDWYAFFDYDLKLSDEAKTALVFVALDFQPD